MNLMSVKISLDVPATCITYILFSYSNLIDQVKHSIFGGVRITRI